MTVRSDDHAGQPLAYKYRPLLRPATNSTLPQDLKWDFVEKPAGYPIDRPDLPQSQHPYGVIVLDRRLADDECFRFGMQVEP